MVDSSARSVSVRWAGLMRNTPSGLTAQLSFEIYAVAESRCKMLTRINDRKTYLRG